MDIPHKWPNKNGKPGLFHPYNWNCYFTLLITGDFGPTWWQSFRNLEVSPKTWETPRKMPFQDDFDSTWEQNCKSNLGFACPLPIKSTKKFGWKPNCLVGNIGYTKKKLSKFRKKIGCKKKLGGLQRLVGSTPPKFRMHFLGS